MNRLQKKCLLISAAMHALLLALLVVGPAFVPARKPIDDLPLLDVIPAKLVDELVSGGGTPGPPPPPLPRPSPGPEVSRPQPAPKPAPPKPQSTPDDDSLEPAKTPAGKRPINMKRVTRTVGGESADSNSKSAAQQADRSRAAANAWRQSIDQSVQSLRASLSSSTTIEEFGTGGIGGGEAYANYAQAIKSIYDAAWRDAPEDVVDDSLTTEVKVAIARDGRVISARIVTPSGNAALDRSVRRALDRVESVPPFPKGAKETERIYTIYFNLKAKRLLG